MNLPLSYHGYFLIESGFHMTKVTGEFQGHGQIRRSRLNPKTDNHLGLLTTQKREVESCLIKHHVVCLSKPFSACSFAGEVVHTYPMPEITLRTPLIPFPTQLSSSCQPQLAHSSDSTISHLSRIASSFHRIFGAHRLPARCRGCRPSGRR